MPSEENVQPESQEESAATESSSTAPESAMEAVRREIGELADSVRARSNGDRPPAPPKRRRQALKNSAGRVAIVAGRRTPFVKAGTVFGEMDTIDLASIPAADLVHSLELDPDEIDLSVFGVVVPALYAPNLGREVVLRASLPASIPGTTVNLACASSNRAITTGAEAILSGQADVVLAGGAESLSKVPITFSDAASKSFIDASRAKSVPQKMSILSKIRPKDLAPVPPAIAEYVTGETMGQSCEKMAKENAISREAQDEIALHSHLCAARAAAAGEFDEQITATFTHPKQSAITADSGVRADSSMEALAGLRPVFDRSYGTLTAGNSSPLTDGGSAVLLMNEKKAKALGYEPLGYIRSYSYAALHPGVQLLQGPAYAAPQALERAGLKLADIDLVEMHEAFAAQILSNMKAFASKKFAENELGRSEPVGEVDLDKFNVTGGSIAIGHPFGATGARVTMQALHALKRRGGNFGLITVCAAGGSGFAMVVERE